MFEKKKLGIKINDRLSFNTIRDGLFRRCSRMGGEGGSKKPSLPRICHTNSVMMKLGTVTH